MTNDVLKAKLQAELGSLKNQLANAKVQASALEGAVLFAEHALKLIEQPDPEPEKKADETPAEVPPVEEQKPLVEDVAEEVVIEEAAA